MEDKELQELFAAKRTVEANRHRQEELRKMLSATAAPKSRRLWPVWVLSAAASVALLLITMPLLFRNEAADPLLVAEATMPKSEEPAHSSSSPKLGEGDHTKCGGGVCKKPIQHTPPSALRAATPSNLEGELADAVEEPALVAEAEEQQPDETPVAEASLPTTDTPTIHRRTSTRLAQSGNIVTVETNDNLNFLASLFSTETHTPFTLKTIEF